MPHLPSPFHIYSYRSLSPLLLGAVSRIVNSHTYVPLLLMLQQHTLTIFLHSRPVQFNLPSLTIDSHLQVPDLYPLCNTTLDEKCTGKLHNHPTSYAVDNAGAGAAANTTSASLYFCRIVLYCSNVESFARFFSFLRRSMVINKEIEEEIVRMHI
ncbi:unnamed protein product [Thelazia callipaeda]|uniref:UDENN domain-containing protein n=1 Tax=Thelazia callipaeda TaxID=103827 RepID=A0A0N5CYV7_THECL|nr:unnamed protein product [Thelazia callipaeda]